MSLQRRQFFVGLAVALLAIAAGMQWPARPSFNYLDGDTAPFVASFDPPPRPGSPETRRELDTLLDMQRTRSEARVAAARADRKTEVSRFYPALGFDADRPPSLPKVNRLAQRVEDDVRVFEVPARFMSNSAFTLRDPASLAGEMDPTWDRGVVASQQEMLRVLQAAFWRCLNASGAVGYFGSGDRFVGVTSDRALGFALARSVAAPATS